jgi:hypothetical protein
MSGIYKGAGPKLLQSVLTAAILFASQRRIYELTKVTPSFLSEFTSTLTFVLGRCTRDCEVTGFICIVLANIYRNGMSN